jgi:hypothetical protein
MQTPPTKTERNVRVIVILPTFNEAQNIPILVPFLLDGGAQIDVLIVLALAACGGGHRRRRWAAAAFEARLGELIGPSAER